MNRVAKNATWIIACKIAQSGFALLINMLTARYLGPANFGLVTYAASLVAFATPIMQLGFANTLVQEIVDDPELEGQKLGTSITLSVISSVLCLVGVIAFAYFANPGDRTTVIVCALFSLLLVFQALDLVQYWFQAKLLSKYTSIISLIAYLCVSGYKIYLLVTHKSVYWFAISNALDYAIISIGSIVAYRRLSTINLSFSWKLGKEMFSRSKHYILSSMMVTIFAQTDKIMIKPMISEEATGYYGAAVACAGLTNFVFAAIIDSFRPSIFEGKKESESLFENRLATLYSIVIYVSLAQCLFMTAFSRIIIRVLYGLSYMPAASALQIIVWYTTFSYIGSIRNIWILANGKQKYLWKINILGAVANVLLNLVLIPIMGINGAALASLITQFFTNVITGYMIKPITPNNQIMIKSLNPGYLVEVAKKLIGKKH